MSESKPKSATEKSTTRAQVLLMAALIGGVTLALFWSATRFGFLNLDDDMYVHGNRTES